MLTLEQFIEKYQGKIVGYPTDENYAGECLSLTKKYMKECFGFNPPPSGSNSAYGYWTNFPDPLGNYFDKVNNTPNGVPVKGDVPIWNTNVGNGYGHIDIFLSGTVNSFTGFDQNWNGRQAHKVSHNYNNVVGWLHPKSDTMPPDGDSITILKSTFEELVSKSSKYDGFLAKGWDNVGKVEQLLQDLRDSLETEKTAKNDAEEKAEAWRTKLNDLLHFLASDEALQTRIDEVEIRNKAKMFGKISGELEDIKIDYAADKESWDIKKSEFTAEIEKLKALLKEEKYLEGVDFEELLGEIVRRFVKILGRK